MINNVNTDTYTLIDFITNKKLVSLNDYISVEYSGYDMGYGTATVVFDYDDFENDYLGKLKGDYDDFIDDCLSGSLSKSHSLSNGEIIFYEWDCNDNRVKELYNVKLEYSNIEFEVQNLATPKIIDPFENYHISFSGIDPYGIATGDSSQTNIEPIEFELFDGDNLSNGDIVSVALKYQYAPYKYTYLNGDEYIDQGIILSATRKEFVVEGLDEYVTDLSDISDNELQNIIDSVSFKYIAQVVNSNSSGEFSLVDPKVYAVGFCSPQEIGDFKTPELFLIYKCYSTQGGHEGFTCLG